MKYFALAMSAIYVAAGLALLFSNALIELIPRFRIPLGVLLAGYGIVRFVLWRKKNAQQAGNE
jgi:hypothetical protein